MKNKILSVHKPSKQTWSNTLYFEHYFAGLIDGDGHFSKQHQCVIAFHAKDRSLAYSLKKHLGYGSVRPVKEKKAFLFIISKKEGLEKVSSLVYNKLKHPERIRQFNTRIAPYLKQNPTNTHSLIEWNTGWLAGFFDADGFFYIQIIQRKRTHEIRLQMKIDQKSDILLKQIQKQFGGYLGFRKSQDTYYYSSTSFRNCHRFLTYFDTYSVHAKYLEYTIMRKAYLIVQKGEHLQSRLQIEQCKRALERERKKY